MNNEYNTKNAYEGVGERRNIILTEQFETAVRDFYKNNSQLISENVIYSINNNEDGLGEHIETIFGYFANEISGIDFGKYALENGFFNNNDEDIIDKYIYDWDDDTGVIDYSELSLKDKINYFAGTIQCYIDMLDLVNDIYTNLNNELYLK